MSKDNSSATKQFVEVADVRGPLVLLKDGSLRAIVSVESVNFDLKSNDEQTGILRGFQDMLNSLDFPLQIIVNSRKLDLTPYLNMLEQVKAGLTNELLIIQMTEYARFIKGLADLANIMSKTFFVIVPYHAIEAAKEESRGIMATIKNVFASGKHAKKLTDADLQKYQSQLEQRVSIVMGGLTPLGVKAQMLEGEDLINLYYAYYNPGQTLSALPTT